MLILLHGDNLAGSREELNKLRDEARDKELRILDGKSLTATSLTSAAESSSMFGGDILIIIERLLSALGRKSKANDKITGLLVSASENADIILWEDKEISSTVIKSLGSKAQIKIFKLPVVIFQFLDNFMPGKTKYLLDLYENLIENQPAEVIFTMLTRRIRQLIMIKDKVIPEGLQEWQLGRLTNQARAFTIESLMSIYQKLINVDYAIKTGASPLALSQQISLILADL